MYSAINQPVSPKYPLVESISNRIVHISGIANLSYEELVLKTKHEKHKSFQKNCTIHQTW